MTRTVIVALFGLVLGGAAAGCVHEPPPIVVYEDRLDSIWIDYDPVAAGAGHDHPVLIAPERLEMILDGVWVKERNILAGEVARVVTGEPPGTPAFTPKQVKELAMYLSEALRKASPKDMATFWLTMPSPTQGNLITSGGVFVRGGKLYVFLANWHTSPSSKIYETTYEVETRDTPMLPIARYQYRAGFSPAVAWVPNERLRGKDGYERYMDESKLVIVDLAKLFPSEPRPRAPGAGEGARRP